MQRKPDMHIVVTDPLRAGHEIAYYPGETNLRMADVVIGTPIDLRKLIKINKPAVRVTYELHEIGRPDLDDVLKKIA